MPLVRGNLHPPPAEAHAFPLQAQALFPTGLARHGNAPAGGDHAMPGQAVARAQRPRHLPRRAGMAGPGGDLPIGGDAAAGNAADYFSDAGMQPAGSNAGIPAVGGDAYVPPVGVIAHMQPGGGGAARTAATAAPRRALRSSTLPRWAPPR